MGVEVMKFPELPIIADLGGSFRSADGSPAPPLSAWEFLNFKSGWQLWRSSLVEILTVDRKVTQLTIGPPMAWVSGEILSRAKAARRCCDSQCPTRGIRW
jgi:hypothetical protein